MRHLWRNDLDLRAYEMKTGTISYPGNIHAHFGFAMLLRSQVRRRYERETDRQTDGGTRPVMRPIRTAAYKRKNKWAIHNYWKTVVLQQSVTQESTLFHRLAWHNNSMPNANNSIISCYTRLNIHCITVQCKVRVLAKTNLRFWSVSVPVLNFPL